MSVACSKLILGGTSNLAAVSALLFITLGELLMQITYSLESYQTSVELFLFYDSLG